jgi:UDP-glucose 4-epimerase
VKKSLLVTGGAGYIGSHVVDLLAKQGYSVVVFDNLSTGHAEAVHPDAIFVKGDLLNREDVRALFKIFQFDSILHFASHTLVGESMQKPWLYLRDNVLASSNLLDAAIEHNVHKFVLSSTANLFDKPAQIPISAEEAIIPGSPYGASKYMIEQQLAWMERLYGLTYCTLRYFNAAGAHASGHLGEDHNPEYHLIPNVLQVALGQQQHVKIYGDDYDTPDGTCIRDFIHVMDLAEAHVLALEALDDGRSRRYNLGNGRGYSVLEVLETARRITKQPIPAIFGKRRPGDPPVLVADSTRFQQELGWKPRYSDLSFIIETAWKWHHTHPLGYQRRVDSSLKLHSDFLKAVIDAANLRPLAVNGALAAVN